MKLSYQKWRIETSTHVDETMARAAPRNQREAEGERPEDRSGAVGSEEDQEQINHDAGVDEDVVYRRLLAEGEQPAED